MVDIQNLQPLMFLVMISIGLDGYRKVPVALIDGVVVKGVVAAASPAISQLNTSLLPPAMSNATI